MIKDCAVGSSREAGSEKGIVTRQIGNGRGEGLDEREQIVDGLQGDHTRSEWEYAPSSCLGE